MVAAEQNTDTPNAGVGPAGATTPSVVADANATEEIEVDAEPAPPGPGERACPTCAEPNQEARRFCQSCGTTLPVLEPTDLTAEPDDAPRQSLRERLSRKGKGRGRGRGGGRRGSGGQAAQQAQRHARGKVPEGVRQKAQVAGSWRQRAKAAGQGDRMSYSSGFSPKAKLKVGAAVLVAVVGLVALLGPGRERVLALLGRGPVGVSPAGAELLVENGEAGDDEPPSGDDSSAGQQEEVAGFPPANIHDDDKQTGAGIEWDPEADPEPAGFVLTLEEPTKVGRLVISPGLPDSVEEGPLILRPSQVRVCSDAGTCQELELKDSPSPQTHKVSLGDQVSSIDLTVLDVYQPSYPTYHLAVFGEVRVAS